MTVGQSSGAISIIEFGRIEGILNKKYRAQYKDKYWVCSINNSYDKVLNLASDPKEHLFQACTLYQILVYRSKPVHMPW